MTAPSAPAVTIDEAPISTDDLVAIAHGATAELGPVAAARIRASRALVDELVRGDALIYGLNTGLGHMRNERMPTEIIEAMQPWIVRGHAGGIGPRLPAEVVRAAMAVRVAGIARGGSGASPEVATTYLAMLAAGVHPVVPLVGSVGASDLMHMAAIALVAMGEGLAEVDDEVLPGGEALARAGIEPLRLRAKDALTVISANGVAIGEAALAVGRAHRLAEAADLVVAISLEAIGGNPSIVDPAVEAAKPVPGQAAAAARIRSLLSGSRLCTPDGAQSVQDALSFRVAPQVHGAFRAIVQFARDAVDGELAATDDNPLVVVEERRMISNGNFHPMLMALAVDAVRPALAQVAQLSDRRSGHVWDRLAAEPETFSPDGFERLTRWGSPLLRWAAAARYAELRTIAGPATLDVGPLDVGVEDHATNAPLAARRTREALALAEDVLAVELLTAAATVGWRSETRERMGPATRAALDRVAETLAGLASGAPETDRHAAVRDRLFAGELERP